MFDVMSFFLDNGMRILFHREEKSRIIKAGIIVNQGSVNETDELNGISHFLEHMLIADNELLGEIKENKNTLRDYGATYNATTYKANTMFYIMGMAGGIDVYLDLLRNMVFNNRSFLDENLEKEKKVVERELSSYYSNFNQISDRAIQALYGEKNIGRIIVGKRENVREFSKEQIINVLNKTYTPENTAVVVFGDFDYLELKEKVEKKFSDIPDVSTEKVIEPVQSSPSIYYNPNYKGENSIASVCFRKTTDLNQENLKKTMSFLISALSNATICNRTAYKLRFEKNLAYQIGGFFTSIGRYHAAGITAVGKNSDMEEIVKYMLDEFDSIKTKGFEYEEFERIKQYLMMEMLCDKNNMTSQADMLLRLALNPMIYSPENEIRLIEKLKLEDVNECIKDVLSKENIGLACIGRCKIENLANLF